MNAKIKKNNWVLILEDNVDLRIEIQNIVKEMGILSISAKNGIEGLKIIADNQLPTLIILDLLMPLMNGWNFIEELKERYPNQHVPLLIISSLDNPKKLPSEVRFLKKPFDLDNFKAIVDETCSNKE